MSIFKVIRLPSKAYSEMALVPLCMARLKRDTERRDRSSK